MFCSDDERTVMNFPSDPETNISMDDGIICISQTPEECVNCGALNPVCVTFTAHRARLVAIELIRLADLGDAKKCATTAS